MTEAYGISDSGYIIGTGNINGQEHAILLTPSAVPEPTTMAALGLGALAMLRKRRRKKRSRLRSRSRAFLLRPSSRRGKPHIRGLMNSWVAFLAWYGMWTDGSRIFPDFPSNHWAFEELARAKKDGILLGDSDGLGYFPPPTRNSVALKVVLAMKGYRGFGLDLLAQREVIEKSATEKPPTPEFMAGYHSDWEYFPLLLRNLQLFRRSEAEFYPQIRSFRSLDRAGAPTMPELLRTIDRVRAFGPAVLGQRYQEFKDVPHDHWAAEAIRDLRALGMIDGYPDRKFHR